jgi:UDP-glucose 4-epimerase
LSNTLVIGCGFIGSRLVEELAAAGEPPLVLNRSRPGESVMRLLPEERLIVGDAADPETVSGALEGIEHVVYSAGGLLPAASELEPELDERLTLTPLRTVLEALRSQPDVSLIYLSSGGTVYGDPDRIPVGEDAPARPLGVYGRLHLQCEEEVMRHLRDHGLSARVLRCATVYGEGQRPERGQGAIVTFLHRLRLGLPIDLYGGGAAVRDYVYVGDVARVVRALIGREDGEPILNLGSEVGTSLAELLALIEEVVGSRAELAEHPARDFEVHRVVLDATRLHRLVGFEPTPLREGVERTNAWLAGTASGHV